MGRFRVYASGWDLAQEHRASLRPVSQLSAPASVSRLVPGSVARTTSQIGSEKERRNVYPDIAAALAIAEIFYKWHSFLLEAGGFLLTWFVLDAAAGVIARMISIPPTADGGR